MKAYRYLLLALLIGVAGAFVAWLVGRDPGLVLIERGGWRIETTLAFAVGALVAAWLAVAGAIALVRWPLRAWQRRRLARARARLVQGLRARLEGRLERAANQLTAAATHPAFAEAGLYAALDAQRARGDRAGLEALLPRLAEGAGGAPLAEVLRAEIDLAEGHATAAVERLQPLESAGDLPPAGAVALARAYVATGRAREALPVINRLAGGRTLPSPVVEALVGETILAAIVQASDRINLASLWAGLSRHDRARPGIAAALAQRATALGAGAEFRDEVEGVINHRFDEAAVRAWADLPGGAPGERLARIERWLEAHPGSAALYVARARMHRLAERWTEAEDDARHALAVGAGAEAWEELGRAYAEQGDAARAARAFANALAVARGEAPAPLAARLGDGDVGTAPVAEVRDEHGFPRLPAP